MTDPESLKQILKDAKEEIERWPEWMKSQEPVLRSQASEPNTCENGDEDRRIIA